MNGIYKVTFEVECCEDKIYKYLNHKRWGKNQQDNDVEKFAIRLLSDTSMLDLIELSYH